MERPVFDKWVAVWGNATSITERKEATFGYDLTLRYPVPVCFNGSHLRFHLSNLTGTVPVTVSEMVVAKCPSDQPTGRMQSHGSAVVVTFDGSGEITIDPGKEIVSDEIPYPVERGDALSVSMYFASFVQLNAGTLVTGPLSKGYFAYGSHAWEDDLPDDDTRNTNWFYFLNTVDVLTERENHALVCYGDSLTAQAWPDELVLRLRKEEKQHTSVIRRAVCGTRILRQYDCATYAAYGLKGETRFPIESNVAGADAIILQHGINDIIHPVGVEINRFRPWSDLPTAAELYNGFRTLYAEPAKALGMKVYGGTLLPIYGWRTYADFREQLRQDFNTMMQQDAALDGVVDFAAAIADHDDPRAFAPGCDSGDHLHPSAEGYRRMAYTVPDELLR